MRRTLALFNKPTRGAITKTLFGKPAFIVHNHKYEEIDAIRAKYDLYVDPELMAGDINYDYHVRQYRAYLKKLDTHVVVRPLSSSAGDMIIYRAAKCVLMGLNLCARAPLVIGFNFAISWITFPIFMEGFEVAMCVCLASHTMATISGYMFDLIVKDEGVFQNTRNNKIILRPFNFDDLVNDHKRAYIAKLSRDAGEAAYEEHMRNKKE
jgi:hypothetical protein